jgi:MHS family alpha-ketoglutarate permease-like MFS transporter
VVFWLRRRLQESPQFLAAQEAGAPRASMWRLFRVHPRAAFLVMGLTAGGTLAFYAYTTYMQKYLSNTAGFSRESAAGICALALLVYVLLQPAAGALSDRIGRKPLLVAFGVLGVVFTVPLFTAIGATRDAGVAFLLVLASLVIVTGYTAINAVVKAELFPAHIRALGVALPYSLANALFGGTAEYVALRFKDQGIESGFFWYVTALIGLSLVVYLAMADSRRTSFISGEDAGARSAPARQAD